MNEVNLVGRLTKDPDVRENNSGLKVARFSIAIDRGKDKDGNSLGTDFPNIACFRKTAELVEKYLSKGRQVAIIGKLRTDSYEKDGKKLYTTSVVADHIEFLGKKEDGQNKEAAPADDIPSGFSQLTDEEIPF